jgi:hypothetical protein
MESHVHCNFSFYSFWISHPSSNIRLG